MIRKQILEIAFLNEPELIFLPTVKWFQAFYYFDLVSLF